MSKVTIQGDASGTGIFTIASPNSNTDRTLVLPDEAGTVLTSGGALPAIDGSALINLPVSGLGVGQTWTNVTASRAIGTTYTNTTGRPITVAVSPNASGALIGSFELNSLDVIYVQFTPSGGGGGSSLVFIVPENQTYSIRNYSNFGLQYWWELR